MSTEIYDAYILNIPSKDVWEFMWAIKKTAQENIKKTLVSQYKRLADDVDPNTPRYEELSKQYGDMNARLQIAHDIVIKGINLVSNYQRNFFDVETCIILHPHKNKYYIRLIHDSASILGECLSFVRKLPKVRDFHYQNSADKPTRISNNEWEIRRKTWNEIRIGDRQVVLDICNKDIFFNLDPFYSMAASMKL